MVVESVKVGVVTVPYEHSGVTLEGLLHLLDRALQGRKARSLGIFSGGNSREIDLLQGWSGDWRRTVPQVECLQRLPTNVTVTTALLTSHSLGKVHCVVMKNVK